MKRHLFLVAAIGIAAMLFTFTGCANDQSNRNTERAEAASTPSPSPAASPSAVPTPNQEEELKQRIAEVKQAWDELNSGKPTNANNGANNDGEYQWEKELKGGSRKAVTPALCKIRERYDDVNAFMDKIKDVPAARLQEIGITQTTANALYYKSRKDLVMALFNAPAAGLPEGTTCSAGEASLEADNGYRILEEMVEMIRDADREATRVESEVNDPKGPARFGLTTAQIRSKALAVLLARVAVMRKTKSADERGNAVGDIRSGMDEFGFTARDLRLTADEEQDVNGRG